MAVLHLPIITTMWAFSFAIFFAVLLITFTIPSFHYAAIPADDMFWITFNSFSCIGVGIMYIIVAIAVVIELVLLIKNSSISGLVSKLTPLVTCPMCIVTLVLGILILSFGLTETNLQQLDTEIMNRIETEFKCCISFDKETSHECAYKPLQKTNLSDETTDSSGSIENCKCISW